MAAQGQVGQFYERNELGLNGSCCFFYDGTRPFCVACARDLKKLEWLNLLTTIDLFTPGILEKYHIPIEEVVNRIQFVKNHEVRREVWKLFY